jgi:unsaturated rhamnogalacturonyl hydrolase
MKPIHTLIFTFILLFGAEACLVGQTWVDSLDQYAREKYRPANTYKWTWQNAALLNTMIKEYEAAATDKKQIYLSYVKTAMNRTNWIANGKTPNAVASGLGLAFLYRVTKEKRYLIKAENIYADYQKIRRTPEGAVSHLMWFTELWDDTVFMVGEYLLAMWEATGDEKYLNELAKQFRLHRQKLQDKETGLWVHGWDNDNKTHCTFCSQHNWANKETRRSAEIWGRGNGWIVVTLSDILQTVPQTQPLWNEMAGYLKEMLVNLPHLQDKTTGHWYQLPVRNLDSQNYIESSCTAMFAYGISTALNLKLIEGKEYQTCLDLAYKGLRKYSVVPIAQKYITAANVCTGTCIGNRQYYLKRAVQKGKPFGLGMFIQFGRRYEEMVGIKVSTKR